MVPLKIVIGDTTTFSISSFRDAQRRFVNSNEWTLKLLIKGNGSSLTKVGSAQGNGWIFSIDSSDSTSLKAGTTYFQLVAEGLSGQGQATVDKGQITLEAGFASLDGTEDLRSQAQKDLDAVQTLIRTIITSGQGVVEYKVGNRSTRKYDLADLRSLEASLKDRVVRENKKRMIKTGQGNPHILKVNFR